MQSVSSPSTVRVEAPARPSASRAFQNVEREHGFTPLRVDGRLPADLRGTLYRNGPGVFTLFGRRYQHWFDGDGVITAVRFDGRGAAGAIRFLDTPGRAEEQRRGRMLHGSFGTPTRRPIGDFLLNRRKNPANTSVMEYRGRLFALCEAGRPLEFSAEDLATIGEEDLGGALLQTFSAHPHAASGRRALYNFGVRYGRDTLLDVYELPLAGAARRLTTVKLAGATLIHDCAVTERHLVFFAAPLRMRKLAVLLGLTSYSEGLDWRPEEGTEVIVVPLDAPERAARFTVEPFFNYHFANAFEQNGSVVVDYVAYPDFAIDLWVRDLLRGEERRELKASLRRAVIEPERRAMRVEVRAEPAGEFPVVRPDAIARPCEAVVMAGHSSRAASRGMVDVLMRVDMGTGKAEAIDFGRGCYPSEGLYAITESGEYLLTLVYDAAAHTSHVAVIDARRFGEGPIARAHFDHHVPFTFHGIWSPAR